MTRRPFIYGGHVAFRSSLSPSSSLLRSSLQITRLPLPSYTLTTYRPLSQLIQVPLIFTSLLVLLWSWKSITLIVFQNKIIFMPYIGRHEEINDYPTPGVHWERRDIGTPNGITLALCRSSLIDGHQLNHNHSPPRRRREDGEVSKSDKGKRVITVIYLQGNAGSTLPRLPPLSKISQTLTSSLPDAHITFWTISYRGFWHSTGTPTEIGISHDVSDAIRYILSQSPLTKSGLGSDGAGVGGAGLEDGQGYSDELVVWGHSIGAFFAIDALPALLSPASSPCASSPSLPDSRNTRSQSRSRRKNVKVILETPFDSVSSMVKAIYPSPWLPYRYLSPFLRSRLDLPLSLSRVPTAAATAVRSSSTTVKFREDKSRAGEGTTGAGARDVLEVLTIRASQDEIVPEHVHHRVRSALGRHFSECQDQDNGEGEGEGSGKSSGKGEKKGEEAMVVKLVDCTVRGMHQDLIFKKAMRDTIVEFIVGR